MNFRRIEGVGSDGRLRCQSAKDVTFPHPQSRKDKGGNGNIPDHGGVIGNLVKRAIDVADDRNTKDEVNPTEDRAFGGFIHDLLVISPSMTGHGGRFRHFGAEILSNTQPVELAG
jgi:hypothetical protein